MTVNDDRGMSIIQAPHCLLDFSLQEDASDGFSTEQAAELAGELVRGLRMKDLGRPWIVRKGGRLSIYQIISTSHIIVHLDPKAIHADLFSCEPFDLDSCVDILLKRFGEKAVIQYCQRNLLASPVGTSPLTMKNMNELTSNPGTFTHALINWYGGKEALLGDAEYGAEILEKAVACLSEVEALPVSPVKVVEVAPNPETWDRGGISGGYVNLMRQLTMHSFRGLNGAYMDIMAHRFDLEEILRIIGDGFGFRFFEVDAVFQRDGAEEDEKADTSTGDNETGG
jgi:S-adenosylmethionine/arginine decarboxylase-like enzyme